MSQTMSFIVHWMYVFKDKMELNYIISINQITYVYKFEASNLETLLVITFTNNL